MGEWRRETARSVAGWQRARTAVALDVVPLDEVKTSCGSLSMRSAQSGGGRGTSRGASAALPLRAPLRPTAPLGLRSPHRAEISATASDSVRAPLDALAGVVARALHAAGVVAAVGVDVPVCPYARE